MLLSAIDQHPAVLIDMDDVGGPDVARPTATAHGILPRITLVLTTLISHSIRGRAPRCTEQSSPGSSFVMYRSVVVSCRVVLSHVSPPPATPIFRPISHHRLSSVSPCRGIMPTPVDLVPRELPRWAALATSYLLCSENTCSILEREASLIREHIELASDGRETGG